MSAIEASSVRVSTLADGTLRLVVDIEPRHANAAFALFGAPGVPMALAALKTGKEPEKRERMAPLCEWAVYRCKEISFNRWSCRVIGTNGYGSLGDLSDDSDAEAISRQFILDTCGVTSRKELDTDKYAATRFKTLIMEPYAAWLKSEGAV